MSKIYNVTKVSVYIETAKVPADSANEAKKKAADNVDIDWTIVGEETQSLHIEFYH